MAVASVLHWPVALGRVLLTLAALTVVVTPLTQYLWTWDHFLHGGQDFETGMLTIVIVLCLSVLLSQVCRKQDESPFTLRRALAGIFQQKFSSRRSDLRALVIVRTKPVNVAALHSDRLPLRI